MYYFIINPNSRSGAGMRIWDNIHEELLRRKIEFQFKLTEYAGHAKEIAEYFSSLGSSTSPIRLIMIGGDGTISEVLTGIQDFRNVIFGVIPTGSGNDFCRGMQIPANPVDALNVILDEKRVIDLDVPYLNTDGYSGNFGVSCGIGFDAAVCHVIISATLKKVLNKLHLGKLVYVLTAIKEILSIKPGQMTITLDDDRKYSYSKVYFTAVMNQPYEGGGFKFCPDAVANDRTLDVIIVEGMSKLKILLCLPTAFIGKHTRFRGIHIMQCTSIDIASTTPLPVHKDGEICGIQSKISVSFAKNTLKIIMPVI